MYDISVNIYEWMNVMQKEAWCPSAFQIIFESYSVIFFRGRDYFEILFTKSFELIWRGLR